MNRPRHVNPRVEPFAPPPVGIGITLLLESAMLFHPWYPDMMLALEASNVIDLRLWKIARGGTDGADESRLMVKEKVDALFEAGSVVAKGGNSAQVIDMYRQRVAANASRLTGSRSS